MTRKKSSSGFTLIELIIVMVITGIIAATVAIFLRTPVESYFNTERRAKLTDEADSALRFVARDMQAALPNSIVCNVPSAGGLQFLSIRSAGRYREAQTLDAAGIATGMPLQFGNSAMTNFDVIGTGATATTTDAYGKNVSGSSSRVVVGNLSNGVPNCHSSYSAFAGNAATLAGISASSVQIGGHDYPAECNLASADVQDDLVATPLINEANNREFGRFYVVDSTPVAYACDTTSGLTRNGIRIVDKAHVSDCHVSCDNTKGRVQLVTFYLTLMDMDNTGNAELVSMLRRVTIVNTP